MFSFEFTWRRPKGRANDIILDLVVRKENYIEMCGGMVMSLAAFGSFRRMLEGQERVTFMEDVGK